MPAARLNDISAPSTISNLKPTTSVEKESKNGGQRSSAHIDGTDVKNSLRSEQPRATSAPPSSRSLRKEAQHFNSKSSLNSSECKNLHSVVTDRATIPIKDVIIRSGDDLSMTDTRMTTSVESKTPSRTARKISYRGKCE